jgi:hypothetical protein
LCAACIVTVTTFALRVMLAMLATTSAALVGPAPGPDWLTRSRLVSSYCRGASFPARPSLTAMYSLPKSVAEFAKEFNARPEPIAAKLPGVVSL